MMGSFDQAVRALRESELECPACGAVNIPGRSPTIELDAHRLASCNQCGHTWPDKEP